jgi:uncharacterized OB-fold protein
LPWNRFYWESGADGRLRLSRCVSCRQFVHPPRPRCLRCRDETVPAEVSGRGRVATFTVNHQPWGGIPVPYVVAVVELDDDPEVRLTTNVVDCDPGSVSIGMSVEVVFEHVEDVWLPLFRPVSFRAAGLG